MRVNLLPAAILAFATLATSCSKTDSTSTATASPAPAATDTSPAADASASSAVSSAPAASPTAAVSFTDVAGNLNAPGITALAQLGALDATSGAFHPNDPIKRRDFVRWLFKTNNAVFADAASKLIHPASSDEKPAFSDLPASDPDFQYVQGMADSGVSVGFPDGSFKPDQPITREQAIAIKSVLDNGGVGTSFLGKNNVGFSYFTLPSWKDRKDVSVTYVGAIATEIGEEGDQPGKVNNIGRTFGAISVFRPQAHVTRGEAATMFNVLGGHTSLMMGADSARTVAAVLHPAATATP